MRNVRWMFVAGLFIALAVCWSRDEPASTPSESTMRIGVYDSRAVAVAYVGTAPFAERLAQLRVEYEEAKTQGNRKQMAALEREGQEMQKRAHTQAFGTAGVDDILKQFEDRIPAVLEEAKVTVLVSKWDRQTLSKYPSAEKVDVTMVLVDAMEPNPRQRKTAIEIQKHVPISNEEARKIDD